MEREHRKQQDVGVPGEDDQPAHDTEQQRTSRSGRRGPALGEVEQRRDQEERVRVAVERVEGGIVIEVGAEQQREQRRHGDAVAEMAPQQTGHHPQAGNDPQQSREPDGVLIVERETVARQVGPARQRIGDDEERRLHQGDADRVRVDPPAGARPADDRGELREPATAAVVGNRLECRVAVDQPGRQVDVVAVAVRANRRCGAAGGVDEHVAGKADQRERADETPRGAHRHPLPGGGQARREARRRQQPFELGPSADGPLRVPPADSM